MTTQMEKQVLEGHLQQVLEQPLSKSGSPATSQQDSAAKRETNKSPDRDQVHSWSSPIAAVCVRLGPFCSSELCTVSSLLPDLRNP